MIDTSKMTYTEYLDFLKKGCPYSEMGECTICKIISVPCDGKDFIHCYEYENYKGGEQE